MKIKQRSQTKLKNNLRWDMLVLLDQIDNQNQYSNLVMDNYLASSDRSSQDKNLIVKVVYGSVQRRLTLDFYLKDFIKGKLEDWVHSLLRLSIYQAIYLDRVPQHAIVNEAVEIAKLNGHQGIAKLVNAILRNFFRQELKSLTVITDPLERLSIEHSVPLWLVKYFHQHLPETDLKNFLSSLNQVPHLSARINGPAAMRTPIMDQLKAQELTVTNSQVSPFGLKITSGDVFNSQAYQEGLFTIQDESSMLVAPLGKLTGSENVLDACAAPGGKATHIASLLTDGHLTALDISDRKLNILKDHAERLSLSDKMDLLVTDALDFQPLSQIAFDVIYLDAPCSGIGLMRRKPEIKYQKTPDDIQELVKLQKQLFNHMLSLLKAGGRLIYSTCTLTYEENEYLIEEILKENSDLQVESIQAEEVLPDNVITSQGYLRIWPQQYDTDGFFISRFLKKLD
ncbi:16S rRNA (cytosine(967)-C(5))-methyltransferase RsmB [Facklamia sp. 7083-14-GEN3]|uniref:16S rRNA (cytosine(967)-C(5))-methyltransferase RsmB n=1 Tax=Facklamia sp. 7083-14-GEN3 TaxID=2973478 RepID=UPI00215D31F9|nr:16S rRNA (cytosine(967)-C(5))-methyltransferase RsmB [Facklamia sp. 7083-14-GEN3]MCR8969015.1 16S rRNA (cytosine(967)-C(5))-methyltransferase RsmB [Facklamia sp. 7083-14-GEN3]